MAVQSLKKQTNKQTKAGWTDVLEETLVPKMLKAKSMFRHLVVLPCQFLFDKAVQNAHVQKECQRYKTSH